MSNIDVRDANLNLLPALEVLLAERSVTLAARKMRVTQSAMSHSLARLRELFGDPLLVPSGKVLVPTPRAERLAGRVPAALDGLREAISEPAPFDPMTAERTIRIATLDYFELTRLPGLLEQLARRAPGLRLEIERFGPTSFASLAAGDLDFALMGGGLVVPASGLRRRTLFHDPYSVIVRPDHPIVKKKLSLATYLSLRHVLVSVEGRRAGVVDVALARLGKSRVVGVRVPHFVSALLAVKSSDLVCTIASSVARSAHELFGLRVLPPPLALPSTEVFAVWSSRHDHDPAHAWIRALLLKTRDQRNSVALIVKHRER